MTDLGDVAARYGVTPEDLSPLGAFESDVYAYEGQAGPAILKVIAREHRTPEQVHAEVDWLLALVEAGVRVAAPLPAVTGRLVEESSDGARVLVAFRRAPGVTTRPPDWTELRLERWGELLGRLHAHSRGWSPPGHRRGTLREQSYGARIAEFVDDDPAFVAAARDLFDEAGPLLDHGPGSGLVHADLHSYNLLLDGDDWTAIDFDDCGFGSYAFDLAMPLYYALYSQRDLPADAMAARFLTPFLRGFRRHAPDPEGGAEAVALCLRLRHAELVVALRAKYGRDTSAATWSDVDRRTESAMRTHVTEGRDVLTAATLRRWLP